MICLLSFFQKTHVLGRHGSVWWNFQGNGYHVTRILPNISYQFFKTCIFTQNLHFGDEKYKFQKGATFQNGFAFRKSPGRPIRDHTPRYGLTMDLIWARCGSIWAYIWPITGMDPYEPIKARYGPNQNPICIQYEPYMGPYHPTVWAKTTTLHESNLGAQ